MGIGAIYYLFILFQEKRTSIDVLNAIKHLISAPKTIVFVSLLMPVNWLLETFKWRYLVQKVQKLSWFQSLESILLGILLSLITPNRTGELAARLLHIPKSRKWQVFYCNLSCSMAQLQITLLLGLLSLLYWSVEISKFLSIPSYWIYLFSCTSIILSLVLYFFSNRLAKIMQFFSLKINMATIEHLKIGFHERMMLLGISFFRFVVFSTQFVLLLRIVEVEITVLEAYQFVALLYFSAAIIPTAWISDLPVRTSMAYFLMELLGYSGANALICTFGIWLINLLLPALLGLFVLPKINWLYLRKSVIK